MNYTVHGILQARILERVTFPFSRGSSQPRDRIQVSRIADGFFTSWATTEAQTTVIVQNNSYTKACLGVACPELLQSLWMAFSAALQVHPISIDARPAGTAQGGSSRVWVGCMPQKQRAPVLSEQGLGGGDGCEVFSITPRHRSCYRGEEICRELEFSKCRVGLRGSHL